MKHESYETVVADLPLLHLTPASWAEIAAADLATFLADHAVCEQQAALSGLSLVGSYPDDRELVTKMTALAAEEVSHLRRVTKILHSRNWDLAPRRPNPWVQALRKHVVKDRAPLIKVDRLLVGALIEARSCERFSRLMETIEDEEVRELLADLGPAEKRHWVTFHALASREIPAAELEPRWQRWLEIEAELTAGRGTLPFVHG